MICALCGSVMAPSGPVLSLDEILPQWNAAFSNATLVDLKRQSDSTLLNVCPSCDFGIYYPQIIGTPGFYSEAYQKGGFWYNPEERWDYQQVIKDRAGYISLLDIGCGSAEHFRKLKEMIPIVDGVESNPVAVREAKANGHIVYDCSKLETSPIRYDTVAAMHVIEHVPDPVLFLEYCLSYLKPGGKLCLSMPNDDIMRYVNPCVQNMPPHHASHWTARSIRALGDKLQLKIERLVYEPLAISDHYYYSYYRSPQSCRKLLSYSCEGLKKIGIKHLPFLKGQTIYALLSRGDAS